MIFDWHDFSESTNRLDLLHQLKAANDLFKCTVFAVPALGKKEFWESVPRFIELAVHGWRHPDPMECATWSRERMERLLDEPVVNRHFVRGFCAPGWQINEDIFDVLNERGWWVADQHYEDDRRPSGLRTYFHEDDPADRWHGHTHNVCGNGIEETFDEVLARVREATEFFFVSEVVEPWVPRSSRS